MYKLLLAVAALWAALLPPLFTGGACSAEFDREAARVSASGRSLASPQGALAYWKERGVGASLLTADECRRSTRRFVQACGPGPLVYSAVPVENRVCRFYRDDEIVIQLQYDARGRLMRIAADMNPFRSLPLPFTGKALHWGR